MMNGMIIPKDPIILYKICMKFFKLHLHEKTNIKLRLQIQEQTI